MMMMKKGASSAATANSNNNNLEPIATISFPSSSSSPLVLDDRLEHVAIQLP